MSEDSQAKILTQVEFYFSESNLINDRFLWKTSQANDGWVPISVISQFERMKRYRPIETIVEALRTSKELLEVSEDGELVRRKLPLPPNANDIQARINKRSVVVEHFPEDVTLDELMEFFNTFAPTNQIRMKKRDKVFSGAVIVEFKEEEDATKFLNQEKKLEYKEKELSAVSKTSYDESRANKFGQRRGNSRGFKQRGRREHRKDDRRENKENDNDNKQEESVSESKSEQSEDRKRELSPKREDKKEEEVRENRDE
ncbi:hypothetical protein B5S32_g1765 [[Candida] boidinii]|nr:hypothetical protein B5S32_g1765 [[Candida] boidinii]